MARNTAYSRYFPYNIRFKDVSPFTTYSIGGVRSGKKCHHSTAVTHYAQNNIDNPVNLHYVIFSEFG